VIYLLAKYDLKKPLILSSTLLLVGNWMRYAGTVQKLFPLLMTGQIIIGMSQPFVLACPTHFSNLWFSSRSRVSATALVSLASPVGAAVGNLISPALATDASQIPFMVLVVSIISTGTAVSVFFIPVHPPTPVSAAANGTQHPALGASLRLLFKNTQFLLILTEFTVYVALFNSFSTLLNQLMLPRGYTIDTAGFTGALLIVVGLIFSAILSPVIDRTHSFLLAIRLLVPLIAACYVAFIFAPHHGLLAPPFVVASILGAASFSLLPCALELAAEMTYPVAPEWSGNVMWAGGQFGGAILIIVGGQLKVGSKNDMTWALVLMAALAVAVAPGVFFIGRRGRLQLARLTAERGTNRESVRLMGSETQIDRVE
jgi:FLVCR family MFS transporter 7